MEDTHQGTELSPPLHLSPRRKMRRHGALVTLHGSGSVITEAIVNRQHYCNTTTRWLQFGSGVSSTSLCIKGMVTSLWNKWEVEEPLKGGAYKEEVSPLECMPWKGTETPATYPSYLSLLPGHHEVKGFLLPHLHTMTHSAATGPQKATG